MLYFRQNTLSLFQAKKGLVKSWSNPVKIDLTESGKRMGEQLAEMRDTAQAIHVSQLIQNSFASAHSSQGSFNSLDRLSQASVDHSQSKRKTDPSRGCPINGPTASFNGPTAAFNGSTAVFSDASWLKDVSLGSQPPEQEQSRKKTAKPRQKSPAPQRSLQVQEDESADRPFVYCYVNGMGQESGDQNDADIGFDDTVTYLVKCRKKGSKFF